MWGTDEDSIINYRVKLSFIIKKEKSYLKGYNQCVEWLKDIKNQSKENRDDLCSCYCLLTISCIGIRDYEGAMEYIKLADEIKYPEDSIKIGMLKAKCHFLLGDKKKAIIKYHKVIRECGELLTQTENSVAKYDILNAQIGLIKEESGLIGDSSSLSMIEDLESSIKDDNLIKISI